MNEKKDQSPKKEIPKKKSKEQMAKDAKISINSYSNTLGVYGNSFKVWAKTNKKSFLNELKTVAEWKKIFAEEYMKQPIKN